MKGELGISERFNEVYVSFCKNVKYRYEIMRVQKLWMASFRAFLAWHLNKNENDNSLCILYLQSFSDADVCIPF